MLKIVFQSKVVFLGKARTTGEQMDTELVEALESGRTTMTAVVAMKNRGLVILQGADLPRDDDDRLARIERNMALIAAKLGVELEGEEAVAPAPKAKAKGSRKRAIAA